MIENATYIVTGCTGYVGNTVTKRLMKLGCRVVGLARSEEKVKRVFGDAAPRIVYGDIRDKESLRPLFLGEGPFVVIHTVAYVTIGEGDKQELFDVTVGGTENMLELATEHGAVKFLHISSTEAIPEGMVLGDDLSGYIPTPKKARPGYSRAKSMADVAVLRAVKEKGLDASLILLAGVFGPGDYSNTHMTQLVIDFINGDLKTATTGGYNDFDIRDFTDVLPAIIEKSRAGESYLFANQPDEIAELLGYVAEYAGRPMPKIVPLWTAYLGLPTVWLTCKLKHTRPLYTRASLASLKADTNFPLKKVKEEFGYDPRPLKETVVDHVKFLVDNGMVTL